ncbi:MAG: hypothetical protein AAGB34_02465 [Planctomycetota bacterium]
MIRELPTQIIAACFALSAFALAIMTGLFTGAETHTILERALFAMLICLVAGSFIARAAKTALTEYIAMTTASESMEAEEALVFPSEQGISTEQTDSLPQTEQPEDAS